MEHWKAVQSAGGVAAALPGLMLAAIAHQQPLCNGSESELSANLGSHAQSAFACELVHQ